MLRVQSASLPLRAFCEHVVQVPINKTELMSDGDWHDQVVQAARGLLDRQSVLGVAIYPEAETEISSTSGLHGDAGVVLVRTADDGGGHEVHTEQNSRFRGFRGRAAYG